jgi:hypothetical protein
MACDDNAGEEAAVEWGNAQTGSLVTQNDEEGPRWEGVNGTTWHGVDLAAWLQPCAPVAAFETTFTIEPGVFPWEIHDDELPTCVRERLATFPFDPPAERGRRARVRVFYAPDEPAPRALPKGAVPPFVVRMPHAVELHRGPVRWRGGPAEPLVDAEGWARRLTCPAEKLDLVRVAITPYEVTVTPENECVRRLAERVETEDLMVLDVPVGAW